MESTAEESSELVRKVSSELMTSIVESAFVETPAPEVQQHDQPSKIPLLVLRPVIEVPSEKDLPCTVIEVPSEKDASQPASEVTLDRKATTTLIKDVEEQNSVTTLMSADSAQLSTSESFVAVLDPPEKPNDKVAKKTSEENQVKSVSKTKIPSRSSTKPNESASSSSQSTEKPKENRLVLPHKPGHIPACMKSRLHKKPETATEPQKPDRLSTSSTTSRLLTAPGPNISSSPSSATNKTAVKKPSPTRASVLSTSSMQSQFSTAPSDKVTPKHTAGYDDTKVLKKSNEMYAQKELVMKKQLKDVTKQLDEASKKLKETEQALNTKDQVLKDKIARIRDLENQKSRALRESKKTSEDSEKVASLESQMAALHKEKENLSRKVLQQETSLNKQRMENQRLEKELKRTLDLNDQILDASKKQESGDSGAKEKFESAIKDLKKQLKQRDTEISNLKRDSTTLTEENRSLKSQSLELVKVKPGSELSRESIDQKKSEEALKLEVNKLKSMLEDAAHKNFRHENLLSLRGEYIRTLQETDEVNKSRIILQLKENEDMRLKVEKLRKFKAACNEELNNMKNTLINQERDIQQLQQTVDFKNEKIALLKQLCRTERQDD